MGSTLEYTRFRNLVHLIFVLQCCQSPGESVQEFTTTLKKLASHCEFDTFLDDALRDRLNVGLVDEACQRNLLGESSLTFQKACEKALDSELVKNQSNQQQTKAVMSQNEVVKRTVSHSRDQIRVRALNIYAIDSPLQ